jgi:DNA-directed RNA polymerase specialized sigma24 family protein
MLIILSTSPEGLQSHTFQEVFAAVSMHMADFQRENPHGSFMSWLSSITRSKICDHFRRNAGRAQARGGTRAQEHMREIAAPKNAKAGNRNGGMKVASTGYGVRCFPIAERR